MHRQFRLGRSRNLILAALALLVWFYYLRSSSTRHGSTQGQDLNLESVRLERHMNKDSSATSHLKSTSTFDWSSHNFPPETPAAATVREARRQAVRDLFKKNWASYRKHAWMKDALQPISGEYKDQFSGWAATLVDALDTLWIMGLRAEFDEAVTAVAGIDFGKSSSFSVNMFEVNIRYLGGLLAAYDLSGREVLLVKAVELGDMLYAGYNTKDRMPVDFFGFEEAKAGEGLMVEGSVVSASPGTLSMEMTHLSQVTGDPKYYDAVARVMEVFAKGQPWTKIPGLWPIYVSMSRKDVTTGSYFSIGGSADSLYEYLPKMHALLGGLEPQYETMSRAFLEAANHTFFFRPMLPGEEDLLMIGTASVDDDDKVNLDPESEHLGCFVGGIYALAGRLFRRPDWADDLGAKLTKGCMYAYSAMPTGIMPERYNMVPCKSRSDSGCRWDETLFDEEKKKRPEWASHLPKGFTTAKDPRYLLRPEAIESVFILWRITGREEFQQTAWDMFVAVANGTETEYANAAVLDVTRAEYPLPKEDYMESFWLAETLKYFYLAFSPPDLISLDEYVLNTEAHPFRRPKARGVSRPL
ncbi:glycoside hydrolase [Bombardia bombarda]|uniref:alpha-1,2-Mannosidase n=1 Tax=Bombardia bombarda TaxID=252184 RepID=A0AA39X269_9PEZI|nr:glycoside hydrolase [Bombardia bombarda]